MKRQFGRRRLLRTTGAGLAAATTASAGCMGFLGGNRSHGDPATYRRWTGRNGWLRSVAAPGGEVAHEDGVDRFRRIDDVSYTDSPIGDSILVGERASMLLQSDHVSTVSWSGFGAAPTTSSAETVASFLVDEGGSRLDVDLPEDHFAVDRELLYVIGPDGVVFGIVDRDVSEQILKRVAGQIAQTLTERPDEYTPSETWEEQVVTLTEDLGIPDWGFYRAFGDNGLGDAGIVGLSGAYYFEDDAASVVVSGLFTDEPDAEALESYASEFSVTVPRMNSPSSSTDGEFARIEGQLGYQTDGS